MTPGWAASWPARLVWALAALSAPTPARACASCGSGVGEPLVLYPGERAKMYVAYARSMWREVLTHEGVVGRGGAASVQEMVVTAGGIALGRRAFLSLAQPFVANSQGGRQAFGPGDPAVAGRLTLLAGDPARPARPQLQVAAGLQAGLARAPILGTTQRHDELDRFGAGAWETRLGVDAWWIFSAMKWGLAAFALLPMSHQMVTGAQTRAGTTLRLVATLGHDIGRRGRWFAAATLDRQGPRVTAGSQVPESDRMQVGLTAGLDVYARPATTLRLVASRAAALWGYNTMRDVAVVLAVQRAW